MTATAFGFILAAAPIAWLFLAFLVLKLPGYAGCLAARHLRGAAFSG